MAYANYINEEARLSGSTAYWIQLLPWSRHAWRWGHLLNAPPTGPEPPDLDPDPPDPDPPDEAHTAFVATLPRVIVPDHMHAKVQAASAAFASSVSCTLNAAVKAASAVFEYTATPASGAGSSCFYSWSVVPS